MTEQQIDLQERELDYWMARAYEAEGKLWKAEARIKAVRDLCDAREDPDQWPPRQRLHGGAVMPASLMVRDIRRALDGA